MSGIARIVALGMLTASLAGCVIGPKQDDPAELAPTVGGGTPEAGSNADGGGAFDGADAGVAEASSPGGDVGPRLDADEADGAADGSTTDAATDGSTSDATAGDAATDGSTSDATAGDAATDGSTSDATASDAAPDAPGDG